MFKGSNHAELKDTEREHKDTNQCSHRMISTQNKTRFVCSVCQYSFIHCFQTTLAMIYWAQRATDDTFTMHSSWRHISMFPWSHFRLQRSWNPSQLRYFSLRNVSSRPKVTEVGVAIHARVWAKLSRFGRYNLARCSIIMPLGRREARLGRARGSLQRVIVSELNELMTETSRTVSLCRSGRRAQGRVDAIASLIGKSVVWGYQGLPGRFTGSDAPWWTQM